jgi:hypothetical protein
MNQPPALTRFMGTPRMAAMLYVGVGLTVLGCGTAAVCVFWMK